MSKKTKTDKVEVFKAPINVGRENITLTLPKSVLEYLGVFGNEIYWTTVSGVIQLSGAQPKMTIPIMTDKMDFIPRTGTRNRRVEEEND